MDDILEKLSGMDRRSIGRSDEVAALVEADPRLFDSLIVGIGGENAVLRMRCSDVIEKVTRKHPEYLIPYKQPILDVFSQIEQQEVKWHIAQLLPRLELNKEELQEAIRILWTYLDDKSAIVKTFSMQALADLAERDALLKLTVIKQIEILSDTGSPAVRSRGRKLLLKLKSN